MRVDDTRRIAALLLDRIRIVNAVSAVVCAACATPIGRVINHHCPACQRARDTLAQARHGPWPVTNGEVGPPFQRRVP